MTCRLCWLSGTRPTWVPFRDEYAIGELKTIGIYTPYEKELIRKDGYSIHIFFGASTIDEAHNASVVFVIDITERKKVEKMLKLK